jgi:hypothetical protein
LVRDWDCARDWPWLSVLPIDWDWLAPSLWVALNPFEAVRDWFTPTDWLVPELLVELAFWDRFPP